MARPLRAALLGLLLLAGWPAAGEEVLRAGRVIDGDTLRLEDGRELRLAGIAAPKRPLGVAAERPWPLADQAKAALGELVMGQDLRLEPKDPDRDRYGRLLAQLYVLVPGQAAIWVQGALLARGLARVERSVETAEVAAELLAVEAAARAARRGLWRIAFYAVRTPETVARDIGSYQLVEGRVLAAAKVRGRVYLNFGADWRSDFTVSLAPATVRRFKRKGLDPLALEGQRIRVRGWVESFNGPLIEAHDPQQIERLDP